MICNIIFALNPGIKAGIIGEIRKNFADFPPLSALLIKIDFLLSVLTLE
jgi:hypothetical protein